MSRTFDCAPQHSRPTVKADYRTGYNAALDEAAAHFDALAQTWGDEARKLPPTDPQRESTRTMSAWWRNVAGTLRGRRLPDARPTESV